MSQPACPSRWEAVSCKLSRPPNGAITMLTPAQVIPFLGHDDPEARRLARRYLVSAHDPAPATAEDFWAAVDKVPPEEAGAYLDRLRGVAPNRGARPPETAPPPPGPPRPRQRGPRAPLGPHDGTGQPPRRPHAHGIRGVGSRPD